MGGSASAKSRDSWPPALRSAIEIDLVNAASLSGLIGAFCAIHLGSSNQSVGNQVEAFTVGILSLHLLGYRLLPCSGAGYPDKMIIERGSNLAIPLEMKATSDWNPRDSNRRVLTSSSTNLRAQVVTSIHYLLATVIYSPVPNGVRIYHLRLDFLEPTTPVSVRLEASVNHRILANGSHHSRVI